MFSNKKLNFFFFFLCLGFVVSQPASSNSFSDLVTFSRNINPFTTAGFTANIPVSSDIASYSSGAFAADLRDTFLTNNSAGYYTKLPVGFSGIEDLASNFISLAENLNDLTRTLADTLKSNKDHIDNIDQYIIDNLPTSQQYSELKGKLETCIQVKCMNATSNTTPAPTQQLPTIPPLSCSGASQTEIDSLLRKFTQITILYGEMQSEITRLKTVIAQMEYFLNGTDGKAKEHLDLLLKINDRVTEQNLEIGFFEGKNDQNIILGYVSVGVSSISMLFTIITTTGCLVFLKKKKKVVRRIYQEIDRKQEERYRTDADLRVDNSLKTLKMGHAKIVAQLSFDSVKDSPYIGNGACEVFGIYKQSLQSVSSTGIALPVGCRHIISGSAIHTASLGYIQYVNKETDQSEVFKAYISESPIGVHLFPETVAEINKKLEDFCRQYSTNKSYMAGKVLMVQEAFALVMMPTIEKGCRVDDFNYHFLDYESPATSGRVYSAPVGVCSLIGAVIQGPNCFGLKKSKTSGNPTDMTLLPYLFASTQQCSGSCSCPIQERIEDILLSSQHEPYRTIVANSVDQVKRAQINTTEM